MPSEFAFSLIITSKAEVFDMPILTAILACRYSAALVIRIDVGIVALVIFPGR